MEYQKIENLLNDESNKPSKFRTRNWVEINDEVRGTYSHNKQIKFKTSMLGSSLCDCSDAYILVKGNITVNNTAAAVAAAKICAPFTSSRSKINNTQIENAQYIDIVMPTYNLMEYSDNYSKTSGSLWQYCKEIPAVNNEGTTVDFNAANATDSLNFKTKKTGQTVANFWRTLEMPLINCEVELNLNWSADCVIIYINVDNQAPTFTMTETNLYVPVVTLST